MTQLKGKKAIVTGGSRGIGFAIARGLLDAGVDVAICARTPESVEKAVAALSAGGGKVVGAPCDVGNYDSIRKFYGFVDDSLSRLDILVNNAGIGIFRSVGDLTVEEWRKTQATNLDSVYYFCHEAIPRFRAAGGGFVVNISSLAGRNPFAGGAAYNASKFGLNGFSEAMMLDHRYDNIRMTAICPGSVATEFSAGGSAGNVSDWKIQPEDVAEVVLGVLSIPERTLVSYVEIRPSKPRKA